MKIVVKQDQFHLTVLLSGKNQKELSKKIGITSSYFSRVKLGIDVVSGPLAKRICEVMNVKFETIFEVI